MSEKITAWRHTCLRCNHRWVSLDKRPKACGSCRSAYWDTPRKLKKPIVEKSK